MDRDFLSRFGRSRAVLGFTRSLSVMIKARLPLVEALRTSQMQCTHDGLSGVVEAVIGEVEAGRSLSESLRAHPAYFDTPYVHLVHTGEVAGILGEILEQLTGDLERRHRLQRSVQLALVYPSLILLVASGATIFLLTVIVPTFADLFASFGAELPALTRLVLQVSRFLVEDALYVAAAAIGAVFLVWRVQRSALGRALRDRLVLHVPVFGPLLKKRTVARFCRTVGMLLQNGIGLVEALGIQADATSNTYVKRFVTHMGEAVAQGSGLAASAERGSAVSSRSADERRAFAESRASAERDGCAANITAKTASETPGLESRALISFSSSLFPMMVVQMIQVGEKTAELDTMLLRAAEHYEEEVEAVAETLTSILEPILIVAIGLLLGAIIVALYLPMFDMMNIVR